MNLDIDQEDLEDFVWRVQQGEKIDSCRLYELAMEELELCIKRIMKK